MPLETQSAFAKRLGYSRQYVHQLKVAGRLVLSEGDLIDVDASMALIRATENPAKSAVAERHTEKRSHKTAAQAGKNAAQAFFSPAPSQTHEDDTQTDSGASGQEGQTAEGADLAPGEIGGSFKMWQARKMRADAEMAEMERDRRAGMLVPREAAEFALTDVGAAVRASLENIPARWSPIISPLQNLDACHAALVEMVESELRALSERIQRRSGELASLAERDAAS